MDKLVFEHFSRLQHELAHRTGELSAVCEILDLVAARFAGRRQEVDTGMMEIVLRHSGADIVILSRPPAAADDHEDHDREMFLVMLTAAGAPAIPLERARQLCREKTPGISPRPLDHYFFQLLPLDTAGETPAQVGIGHRQREFFSAAKQRFLKLLQKELSRVFLLFSQREKLLAAQKSKEQLKRFFSPEIIPEISRSAERLPDVKPAAATILFADLRGFSALAETRNHSQVAQLLNHFYREMNRIIFAWQGTLERFVGDGLLALFGAPHPRQDDPWRALQAAIEMQRQWQQQEVAAAPLAIGIHSGRVIAGLLGDDNLLTYTAIGDPVNTAHRITTVAGGNQILISETTVDLLAALPYREQMEALIIPYKSAQNFRGMQKTLNLYQVRQPPK